jgi:hypothetical protein
MRIFGFSNSIDPTVDNTWTGICIAGSSPSIFSRDRWSSISWWCWWSKLVLIDGILLEMRRRWMWHSFFVLPFSFRQTQDFGIARHHIISHQTIISTDIKSPWIFGLRKCRKEKGRDLYGTADSGTDDFKTLTAMMDEWIHRLNMSIEVDEDPVSDSQRRKKKTSDNGRNR